jgi:hypothetical protein
MRPPAFPSLYDEIYARKRPNPSFYEAVRQQWEASSLARAEKAPTSKAPVKAGQLRPSKAILGAGGILLAGVAFYALFWEKLSTALLGKTTPLEKPLHPSLEAPPPRERVVEVREKDWSEQAGQVIDEVFKGGGNAWNEAKNNIGNTAKNGWGQAVRSYQEIDGNLKSTIIKHTPIVPSPTGNSVSDFIYQMVPPALDFTYQIFAYVMCVMAKLAYPADIKNPETDAENTNQQVAEAVNKNRRNAWRRPPSGSEKGPVKPSTEGALAKTKKVGAWFMKTYFGAGQGKVKVRISKPPKP